MATVHLICGPIGAGKTTLARRLAETHRALRFSLDEWVMQLFGAEAPQPMVFEWWADHCDRCSTRIWSVARDALALGIDVVLDCGFPSLAHREECRSRALQAGAAVHLHIVDADRTLRAERARSQSRTRRNLRAFAHGRDVRGLRIVRDRVLALTAALGGVFVAGVGRPTILPLPNERISVEIRVRRCPWRM